MTAVALRAVSLRRGVRPVLARLDLTVAPGEWVTVIGPNGAGKSSLLLAVAGLVPASGDVRVGGVDPWRSPRRRTARLVALVPQRPVVPEGLRVVDFVLLGRTAHIPTFGAESRRDRAVVAAVLADLALTGLAGRAVHELSGGELQRVLLARALAQRPAVLLLDEPTSALDVGHGQDVLELVDRLRREAGLTVLSAMHDLTLAGQFADRLVLLSEGRAIATGSPAEVLTPGRIRACYRAEVRVLDDGAGGVAVVPVRAARDAPPAAHDDAAEPTPTPALESMEAP